MFRLIRALCVLLLVATAAGCAKLVYNRLDSLAAWYVGSLVSLDDRQSSDLRTWLAQTLEWHRESELGRYATFLRELSTEVARPSDRAAYQRVFGQIEGFVTDFAEQTAPQATRLLLELTPAQVEELIANLEDKSRERSADSLEEIRKGSWQTKRIKETQRQEALDRHGDRRAEAAGARDVAADSANDSGVAGESTAVAHGPPECIGQCF